MKPRIWSGLEKQIHDALSKQIELLEELLAAGEGASTEDERARWRAQLREARSDLRELTERVEGRR